MRGLLLGFGFATVSSCCELVVADKVRDVGRREVPEDDWVRADVLASVVEVRLEAVREVVACLKSASGRFSKVSVSSGRRRFKAIQEGHDIMFGGVSLGPHRTLSLQNSSPSVTKQRRVGSGSCCAVAVAHLAVNNNSL